MRCPIPLRAASCAMTKMRWSALRMRSRDRGDHLRGYLSERNRLRGVSNEHERND
jgi:hypothetical protein